jgi:hypothetical protein
MRRLILAATLMPLACAAFAQTNTSKMGTAPAPSSASPKMGDTGTTGYTVRPPDPNNCGTPDAPAPCSGHAAKAYQPKHKHGTS